MVSKGGCSLRARAVMGTFPHRCIEDSPRRFDFGQWPPTDSPGYAFVRSNERCGRICVGPLSAAFGLYRRAGWSHSDVSVAGAFLR
jgi:hypothetical protein